MASNRLVCERWGRARGYAESSGSEGPTRAPASAARGGIVFLPQLWRAGGHLGRGGPVEAGGHRPGPSLRDRERGCEI